VLSWRTRSEPWREETTAAVHAEHGCQTGKVNQRFLEGAAIR